MKILFDATNVLLSDMLRVAGVRHRVLASNLAHVETPGYQAQEVTFSRALAEAQGDEGAGPRGATPRVEVRVAPDPNAVARRDGNSVDLDRQMVKLAQNTTWHAGLVQILVGRLASVRAALRERP